MRRRQAPWPRRERGRRQRSIEPSWSGTTRRTPACWNSGNKQLNMITQRALTVDNICISIAWFCSSCPQLFQDTADPEGKGGNWAQAGRGRHQSSTATTGTHQSKRDGNFTAAGEMLMSSWSDSSILALHFNLCLTGWLFLQQEEAKNFITLENLDQRIKEALDKPKNYNFAVDKEGRVVKQTILQWN